MIKLTDMKGEDFLVNPENISVVISDSGYSSKESWWRSRIFMLADDEAYRAREAPEEIYDVIIMSRKAKPDANED